MAITFDDLVQAARAAEAAGDLDGCAACQLEMYAMVQKDRSLLRRVDTTYLRNDYFMRVLAAAAFAYDRGDGKLSEYYLTHFPQSFSRSQGHFQNITRRLDGSRMRAEHTHVQRKSSRRI